MTRWRCRACRGQHTNGPRQRCDRCDRVNEMYWASYAYDVHGDPIFDAELNNEHVRRSVGELFTPERLAKS